jgi:lipopolysaccharide/colanic/teichoic acid biosynthesis glycosyltransferase
LPVRTTTLELRSVSSSLFDSVEGYELSKRCFDVTFALIALAVLSPLLLLVALVIYLCDRGSPVFSQTRVGKDGREFKLFKFRSMVEGAEGRRLALSNQNQHADARSFKIRNDVRVTTIGRFLRRMSIDELPQLWNVVRGEMSIVGPRPAVPAEVARYTLSDRRRLVVAPGLTCIWQVSGRAEIPFPRQVEMDVEYIRSRGMFRDLQLIARTLPAIFSVRGAY